VGAVLGAHAEDALLLEEEDVYELGRYSGASNLGAGCFMGF
jgi:hypothetical protein